MAKCLSSDGMDQMVRGDHSEGTGADQHHTARLDAKFLHASASCAFSGKVKILLMGIIWQH